MSFPEFETSQPRPDVTDVFYDDAPWPGASSKPAIPLYRRTDADRAVLLAAAKCLYLHGAHGHELAAKLREMAS